MLAAIDAGTIWMVFFAGLGFAPIVARRLFAVSPAPSPSAASTLRPSRERRPDCPYCRTELARHEAEGVVRCPACDVAHHADCWKEHGGCTVLGCARAARR